MKQKQKSVYVYTHTHTHTISFVYLLRTLCGRCLQWVSASWQGIRIAELSAGHTLAMALMDVLLISASHPSGCWLSKTTVAFLQRITHMADWQQREARLSKPSIMLVTMRWKSWTGALKSATSYTEAVAKLHLRQIKRDLRTTTSTAHNCCQKAVA